MQSNLESSWIKHHPSIQESFYQKLEPPKNIKDAELKMNCHKQTVNDLDLQLEINEQEIELEKGEEIPYNESRIENLLEHKLKLTKAKRYHSNVVNAYWYYMQVALG